MEALEVVLDTFERAAIIPVQADEAVPASAHLSVLVLVPRDMKNFTVNLLYMCLYCCLKQKLCVTPRTTVEQPAVANPARPRPSPAPHFKLPQVLVARPLP